MARCFVVVVVVVVVTMLCSIVNGQIAAKKRNRFIDVLFNCLISRRTV